MKILNKRKDKDFVVLNLADIQLSNDEWKPGCKSHSIITTTISSLIERTKPDLITLSGDNSWSGNDIAYESLADYLDSFGIPWAPVWGNHDNQGGAEYMDKIADKYLTHPYCIYEKGSPSIGNGNYVIAIEEDGRIVEGLIMMDSHDRAPYTDENGNERSEWAKLLPEQIEWYKEQVKALQSKGCNDTAIIMHIPIYAYNEAFKAAFRSDISPKSVSVAETSNGACWNTGYEDSFGVQYEGICSYPVDDGVFDAILELGSTKHVLVGHDHINNWVIKFKGVRLMYATKTGCGCYWDSRISGGTVLTVTSDGITDVHHEYVDVSRFLN